jgi:hypothetical protein
MNNLKDKLTEYIKKYHNIDDIVSIHRAVDRIISDNNGLSSYEDILAQYIYNDTCRKYEFIILKESAEMLSNILTGHT